MPLVLGLIAFELRASGLGAAAASRRSLPAYVEVTTLVLVIALLVTGEAAAFYTLGAGQELPAARRAVKPRCSAARSCSY